jgi:hypothetical protein
MAKGQKRSSKEIRKPKSTDKKTGPKYMAPAELGRLGKSTGPRPNDKK